MSLSVLSNINIDPLKNQLTKVGFENVQFAGYNQFLLELINPQSDLQSKTPDMIFFHLDGEELLKVTLTDGSTSYDKNAFNSFVTLVEQFALKNKNSSIIISGIVLPPLNIFTHLNRNSEKSLSKIQDAVNTEIENLSIKYSNIFYFDFPAMVSFFGINALVDEKFWYLGRIKYTNIAFVQIAKHLKSLIDAIHGRTKKVLVLDLDNTLWGGIIGEDGLQGIQLSEDGIGKVYRDFQKLIKQLKSIGVLLAVCSKNNETDALEAFDSHKMMILNNKDFITKRINWNNKVDNIRSIAKDLELGLDSFVFIDDNPVEREFVKQNIPELIVPEFPKDIEQLNKWFINDVVFPYFSKVTLTNEDIEKTKQYERNIKRKTLETSLDLGDYINSLDIKLSMSVDDKNQIPRISQLTQKTNQFNLTTKRYTEGEIENFMNDKSKHVFSVEYSDKFGNEGIIAVSIVEIIQNNIAFIDTFLMSCRVIGRNVEYTFLQKIIEMLSSKFNINEFRTEYIPTTKNILAKEFHKRCGFETMSNHTLSKEKLLANIS